MAVRKYPPVKCKICGAKVGPHLPNTPHEHPHLPGKRGGGGLGGWGMGAGVPVTLEEEIEERCIRVWAPLERLPSSVRDHFDVEVQDVEGCIIPECSHLDHDPGAPILKLRAKSGHRLIPLGEDDYGSTYYALRCPQASRRSTSARPHPYPPATTSSSE